ncbi:MAG: HIT domain-containing protein [Rhodanobacter sp.]|nr:MAG: HIT domain-containing protein [Rhodanobacter sp.]
MTLAPFVLDPQLASDTVAVSQLPLCEVRLMNDKRYAWLVLVPQRAGMVEISDLPDAEQAVLWQELNRVSAALRSVAPCDKLNCGALGNIVRQLHLHVVARREGDPAWPGPVWGHSPAQPYAGHALATRCAALLDALDRGRPQTVDDR